MEKETYLIKANDGSYLQISKLQNLPRDIKFSGIEKAFPIADKTAASIMMQMLKADFNYTDLQIEKVTNFQPDNALDDVNELNIEPLKKEAEVYKTTIESIRSRINSVGHDISYDDCLKLTFATGLDFIAASEPLTHGLVSQPGNDDEITTNILTVGIRALTHKLDTDGI